MSFPDSAVAELERVMRDRATRVLIYCNNNLLNAPDPLPAKLAGASLKAVDLRRAL